MRYLAVISCVPLLLGASATAQINWQEELKKDAVSFVEQKMIMEGYGLIKGQDDAGNAQNVQVKYHSEAPKEGLISRDNFVSFSSMIYLPVFLALGEFADLPEPIGQVDLEINIYMATAGVQIEVKDHRTNTANRVTQKWSELFAQ